MTITATIVTAVAALLGGAGGALAAPWVAWGVKQRELRDAQRRELILAWRLGLAAWEANGDNRKALLTSTWYVSLRRHLDRRVVLRLENKARQEIEFGQILSSSTRYLIAEIDRVEEQWWPKEKAVEIDTSTPADQIQGVGIVVDTASGLSLSREQQPDSSKDEHDA